MSQKTLTTRIILRNDSTANWLANESQVLLKGEVGIEFLENSKVKMKVGDGSTAWKDLAYFGGDEGHTFEATVAAGGNHIEAISTAVGSTTLGKGDVAVVKEAIIAEDKVEAGDIEQQYKYTAYVYTGTKWAAMDGNYDASNVYFSDDFIFTTNLGTVTGVSGSKTVPAAGKSVKDFLSGLFAKEEAGSITAQPSCSIKLNNLSSNTSYEVGTSVTPSYTTTFNAGSYKYGPATGVTATTYAVTSSNSESWSTSTGTGTAFVVGDSTDYYLSLSVAHTEGVPAKSNMGNTGTAKIAAGTKTATSIHIKGYRNHFYGAQVTPIATTSSAIRDLSKTTGNSFNITVPDGTKQVVIALYGKTLKKVADVGAFGTDIKDSFEQVSSTAAIAIEGANGYTAANYNVYVYAPAAALSANTYNVTIG